MEATNQEKYDVPFEVYLELWHSSPEERSEVLRGLVTANEGQVLDLSVLDLDQLMEDYEQDLREEFSIVSASTLNNLVEANLDLLRMQIPDTIITIDDLIRAHSGVSELAGQLRKYDFGGKLPANLSDTVLDEIGLEGANLQEADLRNTSLRGARLLGSSLSGTLLNNARLDGADLRNAYLDRADLTGATLTARTKLRGVTLEHARLEYADLRGVEFDEETFLWNAKFQNTDLGYSRLQGLTEENFDVPRQRKIALEQIDTNFKQEVEGTNFLSRMKAIHEDLEDGAPKMRVKEIIEQLEERLSPLRATTNLQGANLRGARLEGADLSRCAVDGAYFAHTYLDRTGLEKSQLKRGIGEEADAKALQKDQVSSQRPGAIQAENPVASSVRYLYRDEYIQEQLDRFSDCVQTVFYRKAKALFYGEARRGYLRLKQNFDSHGDYEASAWAYRRERDAEKREAWHEAQAARAEGRKKRLAAAKYWKALWDQLASGICGYGENAWRVLLTTLFIFLVFTALYSFAGLENTGGPGTSIEEGRGNTSNAITSNVQSNSDSVVAPADYFLFSLGSMTTMRPDGLEPQGRWILSAELVEFATRIQALLSIALTGLLGFVLGNRIRRR